MEMMNYQQKMINQQTSIKMLMEEERFVTEANNAAKLSAEIAQWQKESQKVKADVNNSYALSDTRSNDTSIIAEKKREPLITKAYNAFRETKNKHIDIDNLMPTEAYLDEQTKKSFRDTTLSGLRHAQKLMDSTQV